MKTKALTLTMMLMAATAFVGCEHHSEDNTSTSTNSTADQPMPGAAVSNNDAAPPSGTWITTNNPALTNSGSMGNQPATNQ